jgi:SAM-dependent methyltransferase
MSMGFVSDFQRGVYMLENRYENPKETFKFIRNIMHPHLAVDRPVRLLDVGTAAGEFPYFLKKNYPNLEILGVDEIPELIAKAQEQVPDCKFEIGNILDPNYLTGDRSGFDVTMAIGILGGFRHDQVEHFIGNLIRGTRPGGRLYVFDKMNEHPCDVMMDYRMSPRRDPDEVLFGAVLYSMNTLNDIVERLAPGAKVTYHKFIPPIDYAKSDMPDGWLRLWTEQLTSGERFQMNGWMMIQDQRVFEVELPA